MAGKTQRKPLPLKEQSLFKELLSQYENRTLKRALKTADQILKKVPEHGETLCMKGLVLSHMSRKDEGLELVKKGLVFDMQSHICWHVLGIIKKADKNWEEALKAYTQAVRCDKENMNLLKDTAQLQVHLGLYEGLKDTRWHILKLRPNMKQNWVAYAMACHLNGNTADARKVLEMYINTLKNVPTRDVEHAEVLLYYIRVLEDAGDFSAALDKLDFYAKENAIVDRIAIAESRARLLSKLSRTGDASQAWRSLIDQNPESHEYYRQVLTLMSIDLDNVTDENRPEALRFFKELIGELPKSLTPRRLALKISTADSDEFATLARAYLVDGFIRGIPSLFVDIRPLYATEGKRNVIEGIVEELKTVAERGDSIDGNSDTPTDPTVYLWILYFLALHYCARSLSPGTPHPDPARSLEFIEAAISHTPTLPELFMGKARILKRAGDPFGAALAMEEARQLDGQDRFLNWKAARYRMRAGDIEGGVKLLGLFTKKDLGGPVSDLIDLQCLTYMLEEGNSHLRKGDLGLALRRFKSIQDTFADIEDDQFDFHNYTLRRFSLNVYLNLLSFEKRVRLHPAYLAGALASSRIYIRLHDDPKIVANAVGAKLSDADKKAKKKAKKAAKKAPDETNKKPGQLGNKDDEIPETPKDEDPDGKKLLTTTDPLGDAMKWLKPLETLAKDRVDFWIIIYDVAVRRKLYLQALKALNQVQYLEPTNPELFVRKVDYFCRIKVVLTSGGTPEVVLGLLRSYFNGLDFEGSSESKITDNFIDQSRNSAETFFAAARAAQLLNAPIERLENLVFRILETEDIADINICQVALDWLRNQQSTRAEEFRASAAKKFPLSTIFKNTEELKALEISIRKEEAPAGDVNGTVTEPVTNANAKAA